MKPRIKLAEAESSENGSLALFEHDGSYAINFRGQELMHSKMHASETLLGELGARNLPPDSPTTVLIGGLGLGFTLRSVLEASSENTKIEMIELVPEVIEWNKTHLHSLNGSLLDDPRVETFAADVRKTIRKAEPESYDTILLDVDNGPVAMVSINNSSLYSYFGLRSIYQALKPGGRAVFWSAGQDRKFESQLAKTHFKVTPTPAKTHSAAKRAAYLLYVCDKEEKTGSH